MKKITLILALVTFCSLSASSQDFKPVPGDFSAEVNFSPFSSTPINISYLRFRSFNAENRAIRLGVFLGFQHDKPDTDPNNDEETTNQTIELNIRPGLEKHFEGTDRLSPYIGGELDLAFKLSRSEIEDDGNETSIEGAWNQFGAERGFTRVGANLILGADYYIAKRVYLGTEFGFGFEFIKQSDIVFKIGSTEIDEEKGGSTFQLGPNVNSSIRLGFNF